MSRIGLGRHGRIDDDAGDPLDGLVNLFDVGIVLAIAFLVIGLTLSVKSQQNNQHARTAAKAEVRVLPQLAAAPRVRGRGQPVGTAYRLADGRLVIVSPR